jgi:SAM-dependent methyltransferase
MKREVTSKINWFLDNILPPILRDQPFIMKPILKLATGSSSESFMRFKENYPFMTDEELGRYYKSVTTTPIAERPTDCNAATVRYILDNVVKPRGSESAVLDAACGRGYLAGEIAKHCNVKVTGMDLAPSESDYPNVRFVRGNLSDIPFPDKQFDNVICTHALEHVRDYKRCLSELLRVTGKRLIIVMPRQREYLYTVDLHVHFCPYMYRFKEFIGIEDANYLEIGGDFVAVVDV